MRERVVLCSDGPMGAMVHSIRDGAQLCPDFQKGKSYYGACNEKWWQWSTSRLPRTWMCLALLFAGHSARLPQVATICVVLRNYGLLNRLADWNNSFLSQSHSGIPCVSVWQPVQHVLTSGDKCSGRVKGREGPIPEFGDEKSSLHGPHILLILIFPSSHFHCFLRVHEFQWFQSVGRLSAFSRSGIPCVGMQ